MVRVVARKRHDDIADPVREARPGPCPLRVVLLPRSYRLAVLIACRTTIIGMILKLASGRLSIVSSGALRGNPIVRNMALIIDL
jgi:hypothetical protein